MRQAARITLRIALIIALILAVISVAYAAEFWGSAKSDKYHYPSCRWAEKIDAKNMVRFNSPEEAIKAGYKPCKVCVPPRSSGR